MSLPNRNSVFRALISFFVCSILIAGTLFILFFKQTIIDQITVWRFQPSSEVLTLTDRISLTESGKFVFFASQPELDSQAIFNQACSRIENTTSILGCYSNYKISIYNVTDAKLDGIREVTAAHEMLHAVYQRMSDEDRAKIDPLLELEYAKLTDDKEFVDLIAFYARTEPGERANELHSIIGTSIEKISAELESHYSKYFSNRQSVVSLYVKYNGVFADLTDRAKVLADQLNELSISIPTRSKQYNLDVQTLNTDINLFNYRADNGDFVSNAQFYAERAALTRRANAIDFERDSINKDIDTYNLILAEYNSIAAESKKLYNSIDSTLVPVPSV